MGEVATELTTDYAEALRSYIEGQTEQALMHASTIGRRALESNVSVFDLIILHHQLLTRVMSTISSSSAQAEAIDSAALFLCEALAPFDMTQRGFMEIAESVTRMVQFAEVVCHELRTPLTGMMNSVGMLAEILGADAESTTGRLVANIARSADILKARTDDLLDIVGFQTGNFSLKISSVDPCNLLAEVAERLKQAFASAGLELRLQCTPGIPLVHFDPGRIEQVVVNLLHNAMKYGADGGRIDLRAYADDRFLVIEVQDYGSGVSMWDRMKIFQPNYRGTAATNKNLPGLGLGLALCMVLVEQHRGTITVESEEGRGSLFRVKLPVMYAAHQQSKGAQSESPDYRGRR